MKVPINFDYVFNALTGEEYRGSIQDQVIGLTYAKQGFLIVQSDKKEEIGYLIKNATHNSEQGSRILVILKVIEQVTAEDELKQRDNIHDIFLEFEPKAIRQQLYNMDRYFYYKTEALD